jgi:hypothetical protein
VTGQDDFSSTFLLTFFSFRPIWLIFIAISAIFISASISILLIFIPVWLSSPVTLPVFQVISIFIFQLFIASIFIFEAIFPFTFLTFISS